MATICEHVNILVLRMFFLNFVLRIYQLGEK